MSIPKEHVHITFLTIWIVFVGILGFQSLTNHYERPCTGGPPIVLFFWGKKIPYYGKSVLFGDNFSTKTSEMGEIVFQSPLFEAFLFSKVHFFRYCYIHFGIYRMFKKVFLDRKWLSMYWNTYFIYFLSISNCTLHD